MIILLAVLGIGLVATPIVLENMDPAPVASNIVNKPVVNYSPAPIPVEDIKVVNEKVGKLLVNLYKGYIEVGGEISMDRLTIECAKPKIEALLARQNITINTIRAITKSKPKEFDTLIKNLEWVYNLYKDNTNLLYDVALEKCQLPVNPYILSNYHVIYTEVEPVNNNITYVVFNDGIVDMMFNDSKTVKTKNGEYVYRKVDETPEQKEERDAIMKTYNTTMREFGDRVRSFLKETGSLSSGSWLRSQIQTIKNVGGAFNDEVSFNMDSIRNYTEGRINDRYDQAQRTLDDKFGAEGKDSSIGMWQQAQLDNERRKAMMDNEFYWLTEGRGKLLDDERKALENQRTKIDNLYQPMLYNNNLINNYQMYKYK